MDTGWTEGRPVTLKADLSISYSGELKQELPLQINICMPLVVPVKMSD